MGAAAHPAAGRRRAVPDRRRARLPAPPARGHRLRLGPGRRPDRRRRRPAGRRPGGDRPGAARGSLATTPRTSGASTRSSPTRSSRSSSSCTSAGGGCEVEGTVNVPSHGRALMVANHAGIVPWDAIMMGTAILKEHPLPRYPRFLVLNWAFSLPYISLALRKVGGVRRLALQRHPPARAGRARGVFPEGVKGAGKDFKDRYRLQRFGRGGFVEIALRTRAPIVPGRRGRQRGDPPEDRRVGATRARDGRAVLPDHARRSRCSARSGSCRCRRSGGSSSASRSRPRGTAPRRPRTAVSCSSYPNRSAR